MNTTRILFIHGSGADGYGVDSKLADSLQGTWGVAKKSSSRACRRPAHPEAKTQVTVEHRKLERLGFDAEQAYMAFDSPNAWAGILEAFRDAF